MVLIPRDRAEQRSNPPTLIGRGGHPLFKEGVSRQVIGRSRKERAWVLSKAKTPNPPKSLLRIQSNSPLPLKKRVRSPKGE